MPGGQPPNNAATAASGRCWRFASARFQERSLELYVAGHLVELEPKPLEVLRHLLQHAGEVVTKDELAESVWPKRLLSDSVVAKAVSRLRQALQDDDQQIIRTVHGYGYRLIAPVQVDEQAPDTGETRLNLSIGDHPPLRPLWNLEQRLGTGGHGEAWRASHHKTREQRVFKFALDESSLVALKREITLFRVINDTLGERAPVVRLLDWNLEHIPYFTEAEYVNGGSLADWAQTQGGLAAVALADRLEIMAKIAEAVAAVHSVGVLHKDLKPSNVLVHVSPERRVEVRLGDFGSGGILDPQQLERMGITRLGFTKTIAANQVSSGTPLYLAPEVLAGQPFTVKSDLYALGVMLYQLVIGNLRKGMSPGWERDIDDELLREDVAVCSEGNAAIRFNDAAELAQRLRALERRRAALHEERAAQEALARAQRALEHARARRIGVIAAMAALVTGSLLSTALYFDAKAARRRAESESQRAQAVSDFLSRDMFSALNSGERPVKDLTVTELLDSGAAGMQRRFQNQPDTAADLDVALGRSYIALELNDQAMQHLDRALVYYQQHDGNESERVLQLASEVLPLSYAVGSLQSQMARFEAILSAAMRQHGSTPSVIALQREMGRARGLLGQWSEAARQLRAVVDSLQGTDTQPEREVLAQTQLTLGHLLDNLAELHEAELHLRAALDNLIALRGERHQDIAKARLWLGHVLTQAGRFEEAGREFSTAESIALEWAEEGSGLMLTNRLYRIELALERSDLASATAAAEALLADYVRDANPGLPDMSWVFLEPLALAYARTDRLEEAARMMAAASRGAQSMLASDDPELRRIQIRLAELQRRQGHASEAHATLANGGNAIQLSDLPADHPLQAELLQTQGLLQIAQGNRTEGRAAVQKAAAILAARLGKRHWRTRELEQALNS